MNKRRRKKAFKRIKYLPKNKNFFLYVNNKIKGGYLKATKSTKVAYPSTIMLELTNFCNLECTTCARMYDYGKKMDKGNIDIDLAKKVIDELSPYLDSIGLTGMGETFIFNKIEEIVDYIKSKNKGIIISISTNAVLPNFLEKVSKVIGKTDTIQISIDGIDEVYETIRQKSNFKLLDNNLRELSKMAKESETDLMLNMVVTKENYTHLPLLVKYAKEVEIPYLDFTLFNLTSVTDIDVEYYDFFKSEEFLSVMKELNKIIEQTPEVLVTKNNFYTKNEFQKCFFPWSHFYITWDGYVVPCCAKPFPKELNFGNVKDDKVINVLNSDSYRDFRKLWFKNTPHIFCEKCHFIEIEPIKE